jgi:cell division protein FtsQ
MSGGEQNLLWHDARAMNAASAIVLALTSLVALASCLWWLTHLPMFKIDNVIIEAAQGYELRHVASADLRSGSQGSAGNNFFTINLDAVRADFEALPWVRRAAVRRVWPNNLLVEVEEHLPMAIWGDAKLVNTFGEVYSASITQAEADGPLPVLKGPDGSESLVIKRFDELRRWVSVIGRKPEAVTLSPRHAWTVTLDDETRLLLGREQAVAIEDRVKRWAVVFPKVQDRLDRKAEVIDLRYPNGFAIRAVSVVSAEDALGVSPDDSVSKLARKN